MILKEMQLIHNLSSTIQCTVWLSSGVYQAKTKEEYRCERVMKPEARIQNPPPAKNTRITQGSFLLNAGHKT